MMTPLGSRARALVALILLGGLAACGGAAPGSATPTSSALTPGTLTPGAGTKGATPTRSGGSGGTSGVSAICGATAEVQQGLPATVPAYPGAELRQGYSSPGGSTFGLCAHASAAEVAAFYVGKLPGAGWQGVKRATLPIGEQLTAHRDGATLALTALPDTMRSGWVNVLIVISAT